MLSSSELSISVIVPVYNGGSNFRRCLESLARSQPAPLEAIVVADGDTDGSGQLAREFATEVLSLSESKGPAKARNLGAQRARGDILFFIDADVEIYPDTIAKVAAIFESGPKVAAAIGSYDDAPGATNFLSRYKNLFHHYTHQTAAEEASTFWGACGAIRREIFWEMGGFDERYRRPCVEDIELGYRLKRAGYGIQLCKALQVKHLKRWDVWSLLRADFFYRAIPWTALILRDRALLNDLNLQYSSRLSVVLVYGVLASLMAVWFWGAIALVPVSLLCVALFILNASVYQFFYRKCGLIFTMQVIPWHWFYYFYSGLAFAIGHVRHVLQQFQLHFEKA
ncbi:MAG: glycosyltransferase family 2 protein [Cyanobacteriota bacterium]|nr:glycosyltransferase family 2 protein [Cyanobacteriota bacterium]